MKKYIQEEIVHLHYENYIILMCDELNKAGYREKYHANGIIKEFEFTPGPYVLDGSILANKKAFIYLKKIGLLNNGKCPKCGNSINRRFFIYKSAINSRLSYHICKNCFEKEYPETKKALRQTRISCLILFILFSLLLFFILRIN